MVFINNVISNQYHHNHNVIHAIQIVQEFSTERSQNQDTNTWFLEFFPVGNLFFP